MARNCGQVTTARGPKWIRAVDVRTLVEKEVQDGAVLDGRKVSGAGQC